MLKVENIQYAYGDKQILHDINLQFETGKMYAIVGASGSGKTTLLSILSGIDTLQYGKIKYENQEINSNTLSTYRKHVAIVFQAYNLINYMSAIENVESALDIIHYKGNKKQQINKALSLVNIAEEDRYRISSKLSGGQQQRVSIARALACESSLIFADEPTGNLDSKTSKSIIQLFKNLAHNEQKCVICVTHDSKLAKMADEVIRIEDGVII